MRYSVINYRTFFLKYLENVVNEIRCLHNNQKINDFANFGFWVLIVTKTIKSPRMKNNIIILSVGALLFFI